MSQKHGFLRSVFVAFSGIAEALRNERNFRIQFAFGTIVVVLMILLGLSPIEDSIIILMILVVLSLELINSQVERSLDFVHPESHPKVRAIKDLSAGAVLLSVICSLIVGALIFWPHIVKLL